jgi:hypothetical protein
MTLTWTEVATRIQRAQSALESGQYRITKGQSSPKMFHVWNGDPEQREAYVVRFEPNATGTCTCPDYAHREGPACKHTAMVVQSQWPTAFERWQQKVKDLCQPEQEAPASPVLSPSDVEDAVRHVVELQIQPTRQLVASLRDLADKLEQEMATLQDRLVSQAVETVCALHSETAPQ